MLSFLEPSFFCLHQLLILPTLLVMRALFKAQGTSVQGTLLGMGGRRGREDGTYILGWSSCRG